jgi:tetratricopeptide (TPR) repeat protein
VRGLAHLRLGEADKAVTVLEGLRDITHKWPVLALARQRLGRTEEAREALRRAEAEADQQIRDAATAETLRFPGPFVFWQEWLHRQLLLAEAHEAVHGRPRPDSPYDRLYRARLLSALGRPEEAEAELASSVALRPDDPSVWLARARVFRQLGRKDRAVADLARARQLSSADPRPWVEAGRLLAELGEHGEADAAFAAATAKSEGDLNVFVEASWWAAGPYPSDFALPCPPERATDPSRPVAAFGRPADLKWREAPANPRTGFVGLDMVFGGARDATVYALAYVYADRERTTTLQFRPTGDGRLWVNGRLAFDGLAAWGLGRGTPVSVPVVLRAGRNTLLVRIHPAGTRDGFECLIGDAPTRRAAELADLGLWPEAAAAFDEAERRTSLISWQEAQRLRFLLAAGRDGEYRDGFAAMVRRYDDSDAVAPINLVAACFLPPDRTSTRAKWVKAHEQRVAREPRAAHAHFWLANAYYRAGRFAEAEKSLLKSLELSDQLYVQPALASTRFQLGRAEEAREGLRTAEARYAEALKRALAADPPRLPQWTAGQVLYLILVRETRTLLSGRDPGPDPSDAALRARALKHLAQLDRVADPFARLTEAHPDQPRLWIDRGRRLGELGKWDEAAKVFARAAALKPKDVQVWKERGRAHAELGKWDEAAADFVKALELAPVPKKEEWQYPWERPRSPVEDLVAGWDEVFARVIKLRPKDSGLWARRAQHFARQGRWTEAVTPTARFYELVPFRDFGPYNLAPLLLVQGDREGYRRVCENMLAHFAATKNAAVVAKVAFTCLLAPNAVADLGPLLVMLDGFTPPPDSASTRWLQVARVLAAYRAGDLKAAADRLPKAGATSPEDRVACVGWAVAALVYQRLDRPAEARETLGRAKSVLDTALPRPDRGWLYGDAVWPGWLHAILLVREAEQLIPAGPVVAPTGPSPSDQAARRERKARADRVSTEAALALIRIDLGQQAEAEKELRAVLATREEIAAEEPANPDYQADLAAAHLQYGRFLAAGGRAMEAATAINAAERVGRALRTGHPRSRHVRQELAMEVWCLSGAGWWAVRP